MFERLLEVDSWCADPWHLRARARRNLRELELARTSVGVCVELKPSNGMGWVLLRESPVRLEVESTGCRSFARAAPLDATIIEARFRCDRCETDREQSDAAVRALWQAAESAPGLRLVGVRRGLASVRAGRVDEDVAQVPAPELAEGQDREIWFPAARRSP